MRNLKDLLRHRETYVNYAKERIEDEDWHGLSDAANDLRELDVEIRMLEEINMEKMLDTTSGSPTSWEVLKSNPYNSTP